MDEYLKLIKKRAEDARRFPENTCPASRHLEMMAEALANGESYAMFTSEPEHCAGTMYAVLVALWELRTRLENMMDSLKRSRMDHGDCDSGKRYGGVPRSCTACMAQRELADELKNYKGRPVRLA